MNKLEQVIYQFRTELGGDFVSTDVVGMDGLSIAGGSINPNFDANDASARFAEVMKLAKKVSTKLAIGNVDYNLVTTDKMYLISRFLGDESYYWVVAVTKNATLGSVRMLMIEYTPQILENIPHVVANPVNAARVEEQKPQEPKKEEKPKRNIWADAKPKNDNSDAEEASLKMYRYP